MGGGWFGAPRGGTRTHRGIDYACYPATEILSPVRGVVTKVGYPYGDDLSFRYVEVTDDAGYRHRTFYIEPCVEVGDKVYDVDVIGKAQAIVTRYPGHGMKNHIHYEVISPDGQYIDPDTV